MSLTAYERETVINMNDSDDFAIIITYQRTLITKLRRNPAAELVEVLEADGSPGARFRVPANLISVRNPLSRETRDKRTASITRARGSRNGG